MSKFPEYYDRDRLYQEVWIEPMVKVAKRYGISNVAIAKTCRKMRIPLPGRGYWNKVYSGHTMPKTPLPEYDDCPKIRRTVISSPSEQVETVEIERSAPEAFALEKLLLEKESDLKLKITFNPKVKLTHNYVLRTRDELDKAKKNISDYYGYGRCQVHEDDSFLLDIGPENIPRVLAILQTLCDALESRGYALASDKPKKSTDNNHPSRTFHPREIYPVHAVMLDIPIKFRITETSNKKPRDKSPKDSYLPGYQYEPSGKLCFEILYPPYKNHARTKWYDGKKTKIEDQLNDIIINMIRFVTATKETEAWHRIREEQWQAEAIEKAKQLQLKRANEARISALLKESERLVKFKQIKEYYDLITVLGKERLGGAYAGSDFSQWVEWAESYLEENGPERWELPKFNL